MVGERVRQMSVEEFLDFVDSSEEYYEYIDGELYPVTGAKFDHFVIITNLIRWLSTLLDGTDCQVISNGMLVKAGETRLLAPDVIVVCDDPKTASDIRILLNPILVVEVTSPMSIDYDRGAKLGYYFDMPSIETCVVLDQHRPQVELHTRGESKWQTQYFANLDQDLPLEALACRLPLRKIYQGVAFESGTISGAPDAAE